MAARSQLSIPCDVLERRLVNRRVRVLEDYSMQAVAGCTPQFDGKPPLSDLKNSGVYRSFSPRMVKPSAWNSGTPWKPLAGTPAWRYSCEGQVG